MRWGEAVREINVVMAASHFSIRAQWSGDLLVWLHPLSLAADPQCCRRQELNYSQTQIAEHTLQFNLNREA